MSAFQKLAEKNTPTATGKKPFTPTCFTKLQDADPTTKLKIAVHAQPKCGKTRFILTAPEPVYIIASEPGIAPLMKLFPNKEIYFVNVYKMNESGLFDVDATESLANIDNAVRTLRQMALADPKSVGTVAIDSVTDVWKWVQSWMKTEILKIDPTARVKQQWDWQYANDKYQNLVMQLISLPCHVILTAQDKEEYAGAGQPSGTYEPRWMAQTPFWVDIVLRLNTDIQGQRKVEYSGVIEATRHIDKNSKSIAGLQLKNNQICFESIVKALEEGDSSP